MAEKNLNGYFYPDIPLGEYCAPGDGSCRSTVFIYRVVGYQAHGICQTHNLAIRMPTWFITEFPGKMEDSGEWVLVREQDENGGLISSLGNISRDQIQLFIPPENLLSRPCVASIQYLEDQSMCISFEYMDGGPVMAANREFIEGLDEHVAGHLMDGYGVVCFDDTEKTQKMLWPEYSINLYQDLIAA